MKPSRNQDAPCMDASPRARSPAPGRPRGSRNKTGCQARQVILDAFEQLGGAEWLMQIARAEPALFVRLLAACLPRETEASGQVIMIGAQPEPRWGMSCLLTSITFPNIRERIRRRARPPKVALRAYTVLTRGKWDFAGCVVSLCLYWCPGAESNHRHEDFQSSALPTELPGREVADLIRLRC